MLYVPPESKLKNLATGHLKTMTEGFADRAYCKNFNLLPRNRAGAVLTNKEEVLHQVIEMINNEKIHLEDNSFLEMNFDTICVHGDNSNALEILRFLNMELPKNKIRIAFR